MGTLRKYVFTTKGRLNRLRFFLYSLLVNGVSIGLIVAPLFFLDYKHNDINGTLIILLVIVMIISFVAQYMLLVRRCHDLNHSGWFALFYYIVAGVTSKFEYGWIINLPLWIYVIFFRGTVGYNNYGADPLDNDMENKL